jgi:hypothetical protein
MPADKCSLSDGQHARADQRANASHATDVDNQRHDDIKRATSRVLSFVLLTLMRAGIILYNVSIMGALVREMQVRDMPRWHECEPH